jgi:hypothetical protein
MLAQVGIEFDDGNSGICMWLFAIIFRFGWGRYCCWWIILLLCWTFMVDVALCTV